MNYAIVEDGMVVNIISLYGGNAGDFPDAIPLDGRPVQMGDLYQDGTFLRGGQPVRTKEERLAQTVAQLDEALVNALYENTLLAFGL